jgi:hypothetical protein
MPTTPPTIVAPLPNDPRVMMLAQATGLTRREAYGAAAEAWAWLAVMATDDAIVKASPDALTALVDVAEFGSAMITAGLVGVVDDGLVLPAELRRLERDQRSVLGGKATADGADDLDDQTRRRRAANAASSRRYRKRNKAKGLKAKPAGDANNYRSLGRVAGHEVRVYNGPHGCYAILLGATVDGRLFKLTTGDKAWSIDTVRLVDALPGLLEKWKVESRGRGLQESPTLVPAYAALRDDAERLTVLAKLQANGAARHADGDDASARHADASASSARPSADPDADGERNPMEHKGLDTAAASADRHADAFSSMSFSLTSSSSFEEEDIQSEGRKAAGDHERDQGVTAEPDGMAEWTRRQEQKRAMARKFAEVLNEDFDTVWRLWKVNAPYLRSRLEAAGINPNTGDVVTADAPSVARDARAGIDSTTEPTTGNKPATGVVAARERDERVERDYNARSKVERLRMACTTLRAATDMGADPATIKLINADASGEVVPVALG